jgi:hypothetical protein
MKQRRPKYYILERGRVVPVTGPNAMLIWAQWLEDDKNRRHVGSDQIGQLWVSTVFMGLDHNWSDDGEPILFETMIFTDDKEMHDLHCRRYSTMEEAERGHLVACRYARRLWRRAELKQLIPEQKEGK